MRSTHKFALFFLLIILALNQSIAQTSIDSLEQLFETSKTARRKLEILNHLAQISKNINREISIEYYKKELQFEGKNHRIAEINDTIGLFNWQLGNFNEALKYYNVALEIFNELNDSLWIGKVYNNIAVSHWGLGNSIEALENYQIALNIRKTLKDTIGISRILNNIGMIYQEWGLYNEAFNWHSEALRLATEKNNVDAISYSRSNIGDCYENLNDYDAALENYRIGYTILLNKDENNRSNSFFSAKIGNVYRKLGELDSALFYLKKATDYAARINNKNRIALAEYYLGETYFAASKIDSAKKYIQSSYNNSIEKDYTGILRDNLFLMSEIADKEGDIQNSYAYFRQATHLKDSLFNAEKISKFTQLQIKYFTEQKEQENLILRQNNEIQQATINGQRILTAALLAGGTLLFFILLIFVGSQKQLKRLNTKLEQSEKELKKANADKDKFFTIIAHDLKSPFNGLMGITSLLSDNYDTLPPEKTKEIIQMLNTSESNIYKLLDKLLDWARIQTGKIKYKYEKIELCPICMNVIDLLSTVAGNKQISIVNTIRNGIFVFADEKSVATVFRNLISNAIKFTNPGGKIILDAKIKGNFVEICVSDNGIGIEASMKDKLFEISEKVSTAGTSEEPGTGLGLILCKEFIEKNNGKISVESEAGKGSKFYFTLPVAR